MAAAAAAAAGAAALSQPSRSPIGCTEPGADDAPFREWCDANKVLWPKLVVGSTPETGRCVLAAEDIAEGDVVVEVRSSGPGARSARPAAELQTSIR